ncbi:MAG: DUF2076 family protein [Acidobacteriaceae bacterium]|nr:DUF2076 family protein [Acidobacteriaceae bacterium]
MTSDERNLLNDLANKIAQTPPPPRDPDAEEFIRTRIGNRPDALYLMTQTVLIQNLALQHAQQQIQELQQRAGQPVTVGSGSFLGQGQRASQPQYAPPPPQYAPQPSYAGNPSGAPSFLRGAAQTAAGVAAGALAFEGIQALFSHPGYGGGGLFGGGGGFMGGAPAEETIVNNYYDSPGDSGRDNYQDAGDNNTGDSGQYEDANYDTDDDGGGFDDNSGGNDFA